MIKKALLSGSIAFLFIAVSLIPATAETTQLTSVESQETTLIEKFMNNVEQIAAESQSPHEFFEKIQDLCLSNEYSSYPVVREFLNKVISSFVKTQEFCVNGINLQDLLDKISPNTRPDFYVISYGAYKRLNPLKENSINRFKERLSMWRYSDTSMLLKGRTLVLERQPFGIHQKLTGPQLGFMKGFKGIYIDIENKLTGNSYVFFMGRAQRIRVFDLTPLSK
jgi:hypothetical protein